MIKIGFWWDDTEEDRQYPKVEQFIDNEWNTEEKTKVIEHLKNGSCVNMYMGYSRCRICGRKNGNKEYTDGIFLYPEGLIHYVEVHNVRIPELEML